MLRALPVLLARNSRLRRFIAAVGFPITSQHRREWRNEHRQESRADRLAVRGISIRRRIGVALFFAAALTPTLVPRSYLIQGVLAGTCFAIVYECNMVF